MVMQSTLDRLATYVDEGVLHTSYKAVVPAQHIVDGTEFVVLADSAESIPRAEGSETRNPASGSAALEVIDVPPLELTAVPVLYAGRPDSSVVPWVDSIGDWGAESPQERGWLSDYYFERVIRVREERNPRTGRTVARSTDPRARCWCCGAGSWTDSCGSSRCTRCRRPRSCRQRGANTRSRGSGVGVRPSSRCPSRRVRTSTATSTSSSRFPLRGTGKGRWSGLR